MWIRFEDENNKIQTIRNLELLDRKDAHYCGIETILFTCKALMFGQERYFILKFTSVTHKLEFYKFLN